MKFLSFQKFSDGQSDIHITVKYVFLFPQIIILSQKKWCETQWNLKFTLLFVIAYPTSPYDTAKNLVRKTWLKNALQFNFWGNIRSSSFIQILFFYSARLWTSIFWCANLKIMPLIPSEFFNRNVSIVPPTLILNFVTAPYGRGWGMGGGQDLKWWYGKPITIDSILLSLISWSQF